MAFVDDIAYIRENMGKLLEASDTLTPELKASLLSLKKIDLKILEKSIKASKNIKQNRELVQAVGNGIGDIRRVVEMQNQVHYVSDARQNIGLVAGNINRVKALADSLILLDEVQGMGGDIDSIIKMKDGMKLVLENVDKIDDINQTVLDMQSIVQQMEDMYLTVSAGIKDMRILRDEVETLSADTRIHSAMVHDALKRMKTFSVRVNHVGPDSLPSDTYEKKTNTLTLSVPSGKVGEKGNFKGDKGEPGSNGSSFKPSYVGSRINRARYNSYPTGTSYLSLDEIPTMIYFRKSNAINDWTEGQPFGVSNGGYSDKDKGIDIVDGINIDELTTHILRNMKRRQDGNIST